eukprot:8712173-Pyramimonas_sp.AAC.1
MAIFSMRPSTLANNYDIKHVRGRGRARTASSSRARKIRRTLRPLKTACLALPNQVEVVGEHVHIVDRTFRGQL